jgi:hypothetical protein
METKTMKRQNTYQITDAFVKGMGSLSLFPQLPDPEPEASPWQGVLDAFAAAGNNLSDAIREFKNDQGLS